MQMPDEQQYFSVGESAPVAPPFWRTWKLGALIGGVVIAIIVAVFVVNTLSLRGDTATEDARDRLASALLACDEGRDPAACKDRVRSGSARDEGNVAFCDGLTGDSYVSCVALTAKKSGDVESCRELTGDERVSCENLAWKTSAESDMKIALCDKITARDLATACRANVQTAAVAQGTCAAAGIEELLCDDADTYRAAVAQGTPEACAALANEEYRYICSLAIEDVDQDGDGLSVADEREYGTSDTDPDSDNDGFDDGTEVANGFNPKE